MDKPKVAAKCPAKVEVEEGKKYAYCTCGLSESQPFCDGKHSGTNFKPIVFTAEKTELAYFCQCKRSGKEPFCDGSHNSIEE
jgi:CDGSH-type Zn-finger protein